MADNSNPWGAATDTGAADAAKDATTSGAADAARNGASNPWGGGDASDTAGDWLSNAAPAPEHHFDILHPFQDAVIPLDIWVNHGLEWVVDNFRSVFQAIRWPIDAVLSGVETGLQATPAIVV
ncbi:MAG TPA: proline/glycine betaine ABC transporter permease ProW, partial [Thalassospira sp.]|nr:proline/glycine betaine ABC transporter permease ProW [Thalassospira sp.]